MSDLVLKDGDLVLSGADLSYYLQSEDSISANLIRRLKSTKLQYTLMYYSSQTNRIEYKDNNYGSNIVLYSSYPESIIKEQIINEIKTTVRLEERIKLLRVEVDIANLANVTISLTYSFNDSVYSLQI